MKVIQFFAALSILIIIHEFGHFMFAKLFKTRVEKFYLFFDFFFPFATFMNFSLFKKKWKGTEYGLGWFPLGGYVKIAGMVDESADKEAMKGEPQPWEYRSKKSWQKLLIMLGGIIMNVLLAMVIYVIVFANYGESYLPPENVTYGIHPDSLGRSIGLQDGDKIMKVGGKEITDANKVVYHMIFSDKNTLTVDRNGAEKTITIPEGTVNKAMKIMKAKRKPLFSIRMPVILDSIPPTSPNANIFKEGDQILALNGESTVYRNDFMKVFGKVRAKNSLDRLLVSKSEAFIPKRIRSSMLASADSAKIGTMQMSVLRANDTLPLVNKFNEDNKLNVYFQVHPDSLFDITHIAYNGFSSVPRGLKETKEKLKEYMLQLRLIFTSPEVKLSESLGGFGSIGGMFPGEFDMYMFLQLTAFISIILAFMNLLPIPGLDGGYVLFLLFEMITGVKVSDNVIEKANGVGLVLLLALMLYANGLDVWRAIAG
jgi:regulator of sigma E protease